MAPKLDASRLGIGPAAQILQWEDVARLHILEPSVRIRKPWYADVELTHGVIHAAKCTLIARCPSIFLRTHVTIGAHKCVCAYAGRKIDTAGGTLVAKVILSILRRAKLAACACPLCLEV